MRLVLDTKARRFVSLAVLLFFAIPFGLSVSGCKHALAVTYCDAGDSGPQVGQVASITLSPQLATLGESLSYGPQYGQVGQALSASALDCKGNSVSVKSFTYATTNMSIADINPSNGQVCAGTWNRNTGAGIPDYTTCNAPATPPAKSANDGTPTAYVTATGGGAVSNAIPIFIHPVVTSVVLANGASASCTTDPGTDCCPVSTAGGVTATPYDLPVMGCLSQGTTAQLVAKVYANGGTTPADNITCPVGHLSFAAQTAPSVANIDEDGVITANQPGSTIITATVANSSSASSAGYFSTCPPTSIVLSVPGQPAGTSSINVSLNNLQPIVATVFDKNNTQLTGVSLEYVSTTPQTIPATVGSVTPEFPGVATITAVCQPNTCNPAPFSQIGYLGNGTPLTSNGITVTSVGTSATVLYMGSTQSQYIEPLDFTTGQPSALIKMPFVPNSMVISQDGSTIYLGSTQGLMTIATAANSQGSVATNVPGTVLAVSPDGSTVVVTDPVRQTVSLVAGASGGVITQYGGVGTSAQFTPDSQTVYITTSTNTLLTHSAFTDWQTTTTDELYSDVAVTVPSVGAYFAGYPAGGGPGTTEGRSYCPAGVQSATGTPPTITNTYSPLADESAATTDELSATTDGKHILGAHAAAGAATLSDLDVTLPTMTSNGVTTGAPCPQPPATVALGYFKNATTTQPLAGVAAASITGVVPATNSALAFVTYTGTSGLLPEYVVPASGAGTLKYITMGNGATAASAPVAGVFSTDNLSFYAATSGDNQVHEFSITGTTATETGVLTPLLPCASGALEVPVPACTASVIVTPNLLVQRPKRVTD